MGKARNWTRREVAEWLLKQCRSGEPFVAGIDHAFSFPQAYFDKHRLTDWNGFLAHFVKHWPTHKDHMYVDFCRENDPPTGAPSWLRLTERWTSSAKSVFRFDVQGQVAKSTHAGIPWLHHIRQEVGSAVHFWPFDGWEIPPGKPAIVEVYPSIFRKRYEKADRSPDEQDAYAIARWLRDMDSNGFLDRYLKPPLTDDEKATAEREGWILGIA